MLPGSPISGVIVSEFRLVRIDLGPDAVVGVYPDVNSAEFELRAMHEQRPAGSGVLSVRWEWQQHMWRIEQWDEGEESFTTQWRIDFDTGDLLVV